MGALLSLLGGMPLLGWTTIAAFALFGVQFIHAKELEAKLAKETAVVATIEANATQAAHEVEAKRAQVLQEKLDAQQKDIVAARAARVRADTATGRMRDALAAAHAAGAASDATFATIREASDHALSALAACVVGYRQLGDDAADAATRGLECERRYDSLTPP